MRKIILHNRSASGIVRAVLALAWFAIPTAQPLADGVPEHALKAAVAHKITKFVSWPDGALRPDGSAIRFCVSAEGPIHRALASMQGHSIHGRPVDIHVVSEPQIAAIDCDVLYVAGVSAAAGEQWLAAVADRPVLTFGEEQRYGDYASIVTLGIRRNKVRFQIDVDASERAGLTIAAQLLQLAAMSDRRGP